MKFKNPVSVVAPVDGAHATNKDYVDSKIKTITWAEYEALTEEEKNNGTLYDIPDMPTDVVDSETYSTDETIIGTWIDNRPIYRKVIFMGKMPDSSVISMAHGIDNVDFFIKLGGFFYNDGRTIFSEFNYTNTNTDGSKVQFSVIYVEGINVKISTSGNRSNYNAYAVLEYTKTTD